MTEHYEREIGEHAKAELLLCQERDDGQREAGRLQAEIVEMQQQVGEAQLLQEQTARNLTSMRESTDRAEDLQRQLQRSQEELHGYRAAREETQRELGRMVAKFQEDTFAQDKRAAALEATVDDRNNEIKHLMYRVQELSSKYTPVRGDHIDMVLAKWVNGYRPAVPFFRLTQGLYLFGRRQVVCKISNDKPVFRMGGGFIGFDKFLERYASEELERLLNYETDERTGEPKFCEAQKVTHSLEESGLLTELRDRAEQTQVRGRAVAPCTHSVLSSRRSPAGGGSASVSMDSTR